MVTQAYKTHSFALRSTNVNHILMEIDHSTMPEPARITSDNVNTTHNGNVYISCPSVIQLMVRTPGAVPTASLRVQNVSQILLDAARSAVTPMPTVSVFSVLQSNLNTIQWGPMIMSLSATDITETDITGELTIPSLIDRPLLTRVSQAITPGLF